MQSQCPTAGPRSELLAELFPEGIPSLWCPLLTHYDSKGQISESRMISHLRHLSPFIKGFLIPGSTGDGWELRPREIERLLQIALNQASQLGFSLLIGILKPDIQSMIGAIEETLQMLAARGDEPDAFAAMKIARVCGFAICAPAGKAVSQDDIQFGLASVLELNAPIALYQLPQITKNEIGPETVKNLADQFRNFILFKDSSGNDRVALARKDLGGVFKFRGAEMDYCKWMDGSRVRYDGFLLSTTNCFARELSQMIEYSRGGRPDLARQISERISAIIIEVFQIVSPLRAGNAFANANKAMDHLFAFGSKAMQMPTPRLHNGTTIPIEIIRRAAEVLARHDCLPRDGYLQ
jgi:dihydrodipicolinate synthase/N-acetylneuraminate lyase